MVPNNYTFGVSISSSQYIRHDGGSSIAAHTIIKNSTTEVWAHGILKDSASGLVKFLHPPLPALNISFPMRHGGGVSRHTGSSKTMIIIYGTKSMKNSEPNMKTRKTRFTSMYGYELGKAWRKRWVLRWHLKEFGNIANSCKCCLEANSRQQKQHSKMSVHQQISGWSVEFSSISQMMIGSNDLVGKYEGQKTNKVAKYHQNAWRQKWQVWIGFKTPRVAVEALWARVLCDHFFFLED